MVEIAQLLKDRLGKAADKVSTTVLPDNQVRKMAETNPALKMPASLLGYDMNASGKKAERLLGWKPRSREEAIIASAQSLIDLGLLKS